MPWGFSLSMQDSVCRHSVQCKLLKYWIEYFFSLQVGYLDGYYNYFEGNIEVIENQIAKAWVHVQAWFCHESLGTKISVERVSTKHYPGSPHFNAI